MGARSFTPRESPVPERRSGDAGDALRAVARLLSMQSDAGALAAAEARLVIEVREFFATSSVVLLSLAEAEGLAEVSEMDPLGDPPFELVSLADLPPLGAVLERKLPSLSVEGEVARSVARTLGANMPTGSGLLLPMRHDGATPHILCLFDERETGFEPEEVELARAFASAAAAALAQVKDSDHNAAQSARHSALVRAAQALNGSLDVDRTLARICHEAVRILSADNAAVLVGDESEGLRIVSVYGLPRQMVGERVVPGEGLAGQVIQSGEAMLTNDYDGSTVHPDAMPENLRGGLAVPLRLDGRVSGVLSVGYTKPAIVTAEHLSLLEAFGELAAAASRNANAAAGLAHAARTDSLTGCLNHAAFHEQLRSELDRAQRGHHALSVVMLDLDDFKSVNDYHGHRVGDEVLCQVAESLAKSVRGYDTVGRYGGDEFAVIVPEAKELEATELAGRALVAIEKSLADLPGSVHASAGVAQWNELESASELVDRADHALLAAKHGGARGTAVRSTQAQAADSEPR